MKSIRVIFNTVALLLLLGTTAPTYAEQQQEQQNKNKEQHAQKPQGQNKQQKQHAQKQSQQHAQKPQGQNKQQQQHAQQQSQQHAQKPQGQYKQQQQHVQKQSQQQASQPERHGQAAEQQAVWQQHRAHSWNSDHRTWQQRGGYNGYRIPDGYYHSHFGRDHRFRIYSHPLVVVGGYPRFHYGGYWFSLVDPWPEYWSNNWYENDYVYVEYLDNGYYLYNHRYPRDRIAVSVYVN